MSTLQHLTHAPLSTISPVQRPASRVGRRSPDTPLVCWCRSPRKHLTGFDRTRHVIPCRPARESTCANAASSLLLRARPTHLILMLNYFAAPAQDRPRGRLASARGADCRARGGLPPATFPGGPPFHRPRSGIEASAENGQPSTCWPTPAISLSYHTSDSLSETATRLGRK
jgi:hypothetical protein